MTSDLPEIPKLRVPSRAELMADATVHVIGVVGALLAVPVMVTLAAVWLDEPALIAAVAIYGVSLLAMFGFSAGYNLLAGLRRQGGRLIEVLRRLDHAAIYMKIAGTYTPYAVLAGGPVGRWMLIGIWSGAVAGMIGKLAAPRRWERLSVVLYLGLGWAFVFAAGPVSAVLTTPTLVLIVTGGALYSVGVIFHLWHRLPYQNAIWHLFVLAATFVFYAAIIVQIAQHA